LSKLSVSIGTLQKYKIDFFPQLGLEPYHGVGIIGFNAPEWLISDLGAIFAG